MGYVPFLLFLFREIICTNFIINFSNFRLFVFVHAHEGVEVVLANLLTFLTFYIILFYTQTQIKQG